MGSCSAQINKQGSERGLCIFALVLMPKIRPPLNWVWIGWHAYIVKTCGSHLLWGYFSECSSSLQDLEKSLKILQPFNSGSRLNNIFAFHHNHHLRLGCFWVINACYDVAQRHDRLHVAPMSDHHLQSFMMCVMSPERKCSLLHISDAGCRGRDRKKIKHAKSSVVMSWSICVRCSPV